MDISKMYQKTIMTHYKNPKNLGLNKNAPVYEFKNPSCGDEAYIGVIEENGVLKELSQEVKGCSICKASASVMTETLTGKTLVEAKALVDLFLEVIDNKDVNDAPLGSASAFRGVSSFPARKNCAALSWKAINIFLEEKLK